MLMQESNMGNRTIKTAKSAEGKDDRLRFTPMVIGAGAGRQESATEVEPCLCASNED